MSRTFFGIAILSVALAGPHVVQSGELTVRSRFDPTDVDQICGVAYDEFVYGVWIYGCGDMDVRRYSRSGDFRSSIDRPGEPAGDVDIDIAVEEIVLNGTFVPEGTLLFINGTTDEAEIYAVHKFTGGIIETLATEFGTSSVVGGAYHNARDTFFLLQNQDPVGTFEDSVVAEIDPSDGTVLGSFKIDDVLAGFDVTSGDVDVNNVTGNLLVVSGDETTIAEFTPDGDFVRELTFPLDVTALNGRGLTGLGLDDELGEAWVGDLTTARDATRLGGVDLYPSFETFVGDAAPAGPGRLAPEHRPRSLS